MPELNEEDLEELNERPASPAIDSPDVNYVRPVNIPPNYVSIPSTNVPTCSNVNDNPHDSSRNNPVDNPVVHTHPRCPPIPHRVASNPEPTRAYAHCQHSYPYTRILDRQGEYFYLEWMPSFVHSSDLDPLVVAQYLRKERRNNRL